MPDQTKTSIAEWWQYERRAFNRAKSEIGWTALFISIGGAMLSGGFAWAMGWKSSHDSMVIFLSTVFGLVGSFTIFFLAKLLTAPAKLEKEANEKAARIENRFVEMEKRIVAAHKKHTDLLESQIQTLQTQLDDREKRLKIEEALGDYHLLILSRVREIERMGSFEFTNKNAESYTREVFDPDTQKLLNEVEAFLGTKIKGASIATFRDPAGRPPTPTKSQSDFKGNYWQAVIDHLKHRATQLMKIIDKYTENKGENK